MTLAELYERCPHLRAYPLLYRGSRILVFDCSGDEDPNGYDVLLWDRMVYDTEVGWGKKQQDGSFIGSVPYGPHDLKITGADAREFAKSALWELNGPTRHG